MKLQVAKLVFLSTLNVMKKVLDLIAFKCDKKSEDYRYYKKQIMDFFYTSLRDLFKTFQSEKIIERCECGANLRDGYSDCKKCNGSGYKNLESN